MDTRLPPLEEPTQDLPLAPPWKRLSAWVGLLALGLTFAPLAGLVLTAGVFITGHLETNGLAQWGGFFLEYNMAFQVGSFVLAILTWILALMRPRAQRAWYMDGRLYALGAILFASPVLFLIPEDARLKRDLRAQRGSAPSEGRARAAQPPPIPESGRGRGDDAARRAQIERAAQEASQALVDELRKRDRQGKLLSSGRLNAEEIKEALEDSVFGKRWGADPKGPIPLGLLGLMKPNGAAWPFELYFDPRQPGPYVITADPAPHLLISTHSWQQGREAVFRWSLGLDISEIRKGEAHLRPLVVAGSIWEQ